MVSKLVMRTTCTWDTLGVITHLRLVSPPSSKVTLPTKAHPSRSPDPNIFPGKNLKRCLEGDSVFLKQEMGKTKQQRKKKQAEKMVCFLSLRIHGTGIFTYMNG